jgi:hypothetical protein
LPGQSVDDAQESGQRLAAARRGSQQDGAPVENRRDAELLRLRKLPVRLLEPPRRQRMKPLDEIIGGFGARK